LHSPEATTGENGGFSSRRHFAVLPVSEMRYWLLIADRAVELVGEAAIHGQISHSVGAYASA
jgi:hypothetical protein